ncbi:MAG TPA: CNNM domain-containing protein, partial [Gammaproteobacteria bacterium]
MSETAPIGWLVAVIIALLAVGAFFSGTETALMSLNRYRLRHLARSGNRAARVAEYLLQRPDRLIGVILLGNNAVNIAAAALTTILAQRLGTEGAVLVATFVLTAVVLIFGDLAPKT